SEALKRRCLYLYLDYPSPEREREIILRRVPGIGSELADQVVRVVAALRRLDLKKAPSISETLDWARTLILLGLHEVDAKTALATLNILLKYRSDIERATKSFTAAGLP
ncbi:MAG: AAA family ATPase, partial [Acidimicrobiales bacterium]